MRWTRIIVIVGVTLLMGFGVVLGVRAYDAGQARDERRAEFCAALPNAAAAGAQALIDISLAEAIKKNSPPEEIARIKRVGALYVSLARKRVLEDLPSCPQ